MRKIILILVVAFLIMSCGNNSTNPNNNNTDPNNNNTDPNNNNTDSIIGTVWAGSYLAEQTIAFYFDDDKNLTFGYCPGEDKAISYAKDKKGNYKTVSYSFSGNKYTIKDNPLVKNLTVKNEKLIMNDGETGLPKAELTKKSSQSDDEAKKYILDEINKYRKENGIPVLKDAKENNLEGLYRVANLRANEIEKKFQHERPDGRKFETAFPDAYKGYTYSMPNAVGEVIAENTNPQKVIEAWKKSDGHSKTIKDRRFTYVAVGKNGNFYSVVFQSDN